MRSAPMKWSMFSCLAVIATLLFSGAASAQERRITHLFGRLTQGCRTWGVSVAAATRRASMPVDKLWATIFPSSVSSAHSFGLKAEASKTSALSGATQVSRLASMILGRLLDGRLRQQARRMRFSGARAAG